MYGIALANTFVITSVSVDLGLPDVNYIAAAGMAASIPAEIPWPRGGSLPGA